MTRGRERQPCLEAFAANGAVQGGELRRVLRHGQHAAARNVAPNQKRDRRAEEAAHRRDPCALGLAKQRASGERQRRGGQQQHLHGAIHEGVQHIAGGAERVNQRRKLLHAVFRQRHRLRHAVCRYAIRRSRQQQRHAARDDGRLTAVTGLSSRGRVRDDDDGRGDGVEAAHGDASLPWPKTRSAQRLPSAPLEPAREGRGAAPTHRCSRPPAGATVQAGGRERGGRARTARSYPRRRRGGGGVAAVRGVQRVSGRRARRPLRHACLRRAAQPRQRRYEAARCVA
jgi:hypothetical protein